MRQELCIPLAHYAVKHLDLCDRDSGVGHFSSTKELLIDYIE